MLECRSLPFKSLPQSTKPFSCISSILQDDQALKAAFRRFEGQDKIPERIRDLSVLPVVKNELKSIRARLRALGLLKAKKRGVTESVRGRKKET